MYGALKILFPVAVRALANRLAPRLDAVAGRPTERVIDLNPAIADRIAAGERFDVGLTNPHFVPALIASGRIDGASHRPFGRVPLAIGSRESSVTRLATTAEEIVAFLADRLPRFKIPRTFLPWPDQLAATGIKASRSKRP